MALALNPKFCSHSLVVLATHEQKLQIPNASQGKPFFFNQARKHAPNKRMFLYSFWALHLFIFSRGVVSSGRKQRIFNLKLINTRFLNTGNNICQCVRTRGIPPESSWYPGHHCARNSDRNPVRDRAGILLEIVLWIPPRIAPGIVPKFPPWVVLGIPFRIVPEIRSGSRLWSRLGSHRGSRQEPCLRSFQGYYPGLRRESSLKSRLGLRWKSRQESTLVWCLLSHRDKRKIL